MMSGFTWLGQEVSWLETIAFLTGMAGVALTIRKNVLNFPLGIINVLLYCMLFLQDSIRLYADAFLQVMFAVFLIYGWIKWSAHHTAAAEVADTTPAEWRRIVLLTATGWIIIGSVLSNVTSASLPWLDAALTAASLAAQYMVALKKRENWLVWIAVNTVYIPVYLYKHLPLTAMLYLIFLIMALQGWKAWKGSSR